MTTKRVAKPNKHFHGETVTNLAYKKDKGILDITFTSGRVMRITSGSEDMEVSEVVSRKVNVTRRKLTPLIIAVQNKDGVEMHTCPYQSDINNDNETLCDCDAARTNECYMDT